ncbi:transposase domain-containing protein [Streptomyces sp. NPDC056638]|uniref:transposase domain-containing protein n=1 Tax=Streptomyces sp. NPDC056638 TaxID=3345887 RepID=UPI00369D0207
MHPWVGISDHVRLGVVTRWVTPELVGGVLEKCRVRDKKSGALPAGFMVYFTLALALFQQDSYDDVAEQLVGSVPVLSESIPNKSSFTGARRRLGGTVTLADRVGDLRVDHGGGGCPWARRRRTRGTGTRWRSSRTVCGCTSASRSASVRLRS